MTLRGRLPLDDDGLVGAATCDDGLGGGTGRLLGERQPGAAWKSKKKKRGERNDGRDKDMH